MYLFDLQTVAPDPFQQITQAGDERVLLHTSDANLPVAQLHRFPSHLLHQHAFGLSHRSHRISLILLKHWSIWINLIDINTSFIKI